MVRFIGKLHYYQFAEQLKPPPQAVLCQVNQFYQQTVLAMSEYVVASHHPQAPQLRLLDPWLCYALAVPSLAARSTVIVADIF
jgi:hypothetical protein